MTAAIYHEEGFLALCRVLEHTEKSLDPAVVRLHRGPVPIPRTEHTWKLTVLAILNQGINARIAPESQVKVGHTVSLHGLGKDQSPYSPWEVSTTVRRSAVAYYPPDHPIHERLAEGLKLLTEDEKSALLEEAHV